MMFIVVTDSGFITFTFGFEFVKFEFLGSTDFVVQSANTIVNNFRGGTYFTLFTEVIFSMDVKSLYTCIPHEDGLKAIEYFMDIERKEPYPPTSTILRLTELVLTLNNFTFNGNNYIQRRGVSMGQKVGPAYACLFMGYLEQKFLASYHGPKPDHLYRYIDDFIGFATTCSVSDITNFINAFNEFHPSIKLTHSISEVSLPFLDINLSIDHSNPNSRISTTIHYKSTDSHSYLSYDSSHPRKCKDSIPYSQLLRLRRICSDDDDFVTKADEMMTFFKLRGYPEHVIQAARKRISNSSSTSHTENANNTRIPLVITYHPINSLVVKTLLSNFKLVQQCRDTKDIFKDPPLVAYRRDKNLSDMLVHSTDPKPIYQPGTTTCERRVCKTCAHINFAPSINGTTGSFYIKDSFNCTSKNIVYAVTCSKCNKVYIGETKRRLGDRFVEHLRYATKNNRDTPITRHYNEIPHIPSDLRVTGLPQTSVQQYINVLDEDTQ
ncbi:uncharacterized protein [Amphiura filiformis]|uniref:uncharacterized protein n=1 Tax=Amphiura filiformis TaxID=82378 RepID=UPI003B20DE38